MTGTPAGRTAACAALVAVTAIWGSSFTISKGLLTRIPVEDYLAVRFLLAAAVLVLLRPRAVLVADRATLRTGLLLGVVYGVGQYLQFHGLTGSSPTVSAFLVSLYVVAVPLIAAIALRVPPSGRIGLAVACATLGVAVLSLRGWSFGGYEALTVVSAIVYAVHVLLLSRYVRAGQAYALAAVQIAVIGLLMLVPAARGGVTLPSRTADIAAYAYLAALAGALTMLAQAWAQTRLGASQAAVIMSLEPVWAAVVALAAGQDRLTPRLVAGAALVLAAAYIAMRERPDLVRRSRSRRRSRLRPRRSPTPPAG